MKKMLMVSAALVAMLASPAVAADMGVPRAAPIAPVTPWTGFYIGGNFGAVWGNTDPGFIGGCNPVVGGSTFAGGVVPNLPIGTGNTCTLSVFPVPTAVSTPICP